MPPLFSRVSDPWGVKPPKKIPGVTSGYFWPSLNDIAQANNFSFLLNGIDACDSVSGSEWKRVVKSISIDREIDT